MIPGCVIWFPTVVWTPLRRKRLRRTIFHWWMNMTCLLQPLPQFQESWLIKQGVKKSWMRLRSHRRRCWFYWAINRSSGSWDTMSIPGSGYLTSLNMGNFIPQRSREDLCISSLWRIPGKSPGWGVHPWNGMTCIKPGWINPHPIYSIWCKSRSRLQDEHICVFLSWASLVIWIHNFELLKPAARRGKSIQKWLSIDPG